MDFFLIFGGNFLEIICEDFFGGNLKLFRYLAIKNRPVSINVLDIRIENNHFTCECDKMSWFLGAMTKNFDTDVIANGRGSLDFLRFFKATFYKKYFCILLYCRVCHILCKQIFRKFSSVLANSAQDVRRRMKIRKRIVTSSS